MMQEAPYNQKQIEDLKDEIDALKMLLEVCEGVITTLKEENDALRRGEDIQHAV